MQPFTLGQLSVWHHPPSGQVSPKNLRVLLIHGLSEHSGRHLNTVEYLTQLGYEVVRFDLRGSGLSGGRKQWVEKFTDYVEDVIAVFLWVQANLPRQPLFVLGHSLGGAIALYFTAHYGRQLRGLMVSAPGFLPGSTIPAWKISLGQKLVKYFPKLRIPSSGDNAALSRDPKVGEDYGRDPLAYHFNTLQQGDAILKALEKLPEVCASISVPTLLVHGTADRVVRHEGSFTLLRCLASQDKELHFLPGGYHEPHNDVNKQEYFRLLSQWLERQGQ